VILFLPFVERLRGRDAFHAVGSSAGLRVTGCCYLPVHGSSDAYILLRTSLGWVHCLRFMLAAGSCLPAVSRAVDMRAIFYVLACGSLNRATTGSRHRRRAVSYIRATADWRHAGSCCLFSLRATHFAVARRSHAPAPAGSRISLPGGCARFCHRGRYTNHTTLLWTARSAPPCTWPHLFCGCTATYHGYL